MQDTKNDNPERQIVTMYAQIFRDKLIKLEARGQRVPPEPPAHIDRLGIGSIIKRNRYRFERNTADRA